MRRLLILIIALAVSAVGLAPAYGTNTNISFNSVGEKYAGSTFKIKGYLSGTGAKANKTIQLQRKWSGTWHNVKKKTGQHDGVFYIATSVPNTGTAKLRGLVYKRVTKVIDKTSVLRVRIIPAPGGGGTPTPTPTPTPVKVEGFLSIGPSGSNMIDYSIGISGPATWRLRFDVTKDGVLVNTNSGEKTGTSSENGTYRTGLTDPGTYLVKGTLSSDAGTFATVVANTAFAIAEPPPTPIITLTVRVEADQSNLIREVHDDNNEATALVKIQDGNVISAVSNDGYTNDQPVGGSATAPVDGVAGPTGTALLPDLRIKRLTACNAGDIDLTAKNNGADCFYTETLDDGRVLLKFGATTINVGNGPLEVNSTRDNATDGTLSWHATSTTQRIYYDADGDGVWEKKNFDEVDTPIQFYWQELTSGVDDHGHTHWHMTDIDSYDIVGLGLQGEKHGFCFEDNTDVRDVTLAPKTYFGSADVPTGTTCGYQQETIDTIQHGLSPGWGDLYPSSLQDQGIDISSLL